MEFAFKSKDYSQTKHDVQNGGTFYICNKISSHECPWLAVYAKEERFNSFSPVMALIQIAFQNLTSAVENETGYMVGPVTNSSLCRCMSGCGCGLHHWYRWKLNIALQPPHSLIHLARLVASLTKRKTRDINTFQTLCQDWLIDCNIHKKNRATISQTGISDWICSRHFKKKDLLISYFAMQLNENGWGNTMASMKPFWTGSSAMTNSA